MAHATIDRPGADGERGPAMAVVGFGPLAVFLAGTFALTWLTLLPLGPARYVLGYFAAQPTVVAFAVVGLYYGRRGVARLWRAGTRWRVGWAWYAIAVFLPGLAAGAGWLATSSVGSAAPTRAPVITAVVGALLAGILEEFGWSGVAFPALQARWGFLRAGVILGVIWALWHVPSLFTPAPLPRAHFSFVPFLLFTIPLRILLGWVYNGTGGSVLLPALFHASVNAWGNIVLGGNVVANTGHLVQILVFAAAVVIVIWRGQASAHRPRDRDAHRRAPSPHPTGGDPQSSR